MGIGLVMPPVRAMISRRLDAGNQGQTMGSLQALQSLGASIGLITAGIPFTDVAPLPRFWLPCLPFCWWARSFWTPGEENPASGSLNAFKKAGAPAAGHPE